MSGAWGPGAWGTGAWGGSSSAVFLGPGGATLLPLGLGPVLGGIPYTPRTYTRGLWLFHEIGSQPVDAMGNTYELREDGTSTPTLDEPPIVSSLTGHGREFDDDLGLVGVELTADALRLTRSCTVRAFLKMDVSGATLSAPMTLVQRGIRDGTAAERPVWGIELTRTDTAALTMKPIWEEIGGSAPTFTGAILTPYTGEFFEVAIVRRWLSTTSVEVEYYANGILIGEETVSAGNIGDADGGSVSFGCRHDGGTGYEQFLPAGTVIDSVSVESDAMTAEEILQDFWRITVYQPGGGRILRAYMPPGDAYSKEPDSNVQKWIASEGDLLGFVNARAERMREDYFPDRTYTEQLAWWEKITGISPAPSATVGERRGNVLGFLRKTLGFAVGDLQEALELLFGYTSPFDTEIIELPAVREDDFSVDDITTPPSSLWRTPDGNGTISIALNTMSMAITTGDDQRWAIGPLRREIPLSWEIQRYSEPTDASFFTDANATTRVATGTIFGHFWRKLDDAVFIGFAPDGGSDHKLVWCEIIGGVLSSVTDLVTGLGGAGTDLFLLTRFVTGTTFGYQVSDVSEASITGVVSTISTNLAAPEWVGVGFLASDGAAAPAGGADYDLTFAKVFEPLSARAYNWMAYRDPADAGAYDIDAAQAQIAKQKPAHTIGCAVTDKRGYLAGSSPVDIHPRYPTGAS